VTTVPADFAEFDRLVNVSSVNDEPGVTAIITELPLAETLEILELTLTLALTMLLATLDTTLETLTGVVLTKLLLILVLFITDDATELVLESTAAVGVTPAADEAMLTVACCICVIISIC
jgi:hypothetical protein